MTPQPKTCGECRIIGTPDIDPHNGRITYRDQRIELCHRHASAETLYEAAKAIQPQLDLQQTDGCSGSDIFTIHLKAREIKTIRAAIKGYEGK